MALERRSTGLRLGLLLWAAGMIGVASASLTLIPALLEGAAIPVPIEVAVAASIAQSGALLGLTVWAGVALAPRIGLQAPVARTIVERGPVWPALRGQMTAGILLGLASGVVLHLVWTIAPTDLAAASQRLALPLFARVLYGGITEELLIRWGLMTLVLWGLWRWRQRGAGTPHPALVWLAIAVTAVVFGVGHLPVVSALLGELRPGVVLWVVGANAALGALFGALYWARGLEAAIVAHMLAHVTDAALSML